MTTSVKNNFMPPSLISNLQQVLANRNDAVDLQSHTTRDSHKASLSSSSSSSSSSSLVSVNGKSVKPMVLVTNAEGIDSPGLTFLVEALVLDSRFDVCVCAPQVGRSVSGHSFSLDETVSVCSTELSGATAYEISGTPADCVSLALSGALFSCSKLTLVISGINRGSNSGHNMFYSGAVAGAREASICGIPSLCISLNWKKDVSCESNVKDAVGVCLPFINAAVRGVQKNVFPKSYLLNIQIPSCPLTNKGFKITRQSLWRSALSWQAVSGFKHPSASHFMSNQQSLGIKLAQLGRDASAAAASRSLNAHRKHVEIESIGIAGNPKSKEKIKKYFRLEFLEKKPDTVGEDLDITALEDEFVCITPVSLSSIAQSEIQTSVSNWIADELNSEH